MINLDFRVFVLKTVANLVLETVEIDIDNIHKKMALI